MCCPEACAVLSKYSFSVMNSAPWKTLKEHKDKKLKDSSAIKVMDFVIFRQHMYAFLCFTSVLIRLLYSILSSPFPSLLLSPVTKLKFCVTSSSLFHTSGWYMCSQTLAKTNRFITVLMTAGCMLSEFLNSPKLLFLPKLVELQHSTFYWDCYLWMKNDSTGKKLFGISYRPIFRSLFGETSENVISRMLRVVLQVLNSVFANHI